MDRAEDFGIGLRGRHKLTKTECCEDWLGNVVKPLDTTGIWGSTVFPIISLENGPALVKSLIPVFYCSYLSRILIWKCSRVEKVYFLRWREFRSHVFNTTPSHFPPFVLLTVYYLLLLSCPPSHSLFIPNPLLRPPPTAMSTNSVTLGASNPNSSNGDDRDAPPVDEFGDNFLDNFDVESAILSHTEGGDGKENQGGAVRFR